MALPDSALKNLYEPDYATSAFRFMEASREGPCHYCGEHLKRGSMIAGNYGILWGHQACVIAAWQRCELILSPNNSDQRDTQLEACANRRYWGNKVIALTDAELEVRGEGVLDSFLEAARLCKRMRDEGITIDHRSLERRVFEDGAHKWPNLAAADAEALKELAEKINEPLIISQQVPEGIPRKFAKKGRHPFPEFSKNPLEYLDRPHSCEHFQAELIQIVTMPTSMRPSKHVIKEFEMCPETLEEIVERMWKEYLQARFAEWKRTQRTLPACPFHRWVPKVELEVTVTKLDEFPWKRALWWRCQGGDE